MTAPKFKDTGLPNTTTAKQAYNFLVENQNHARAYYSVESVLFAIEKTSNSLFHWGGGVDGIEAMLGIPVLETTERGFGAPRLSVNFNSEAGNLAAITQQVLPDTLKFYADEVQVIYLASQLARLDEIRRSQDIAKIARFTSDLTDQWSWQAIPAREKTFIKRKFPEIYDELVKVSKGASRNIERLAHQKGIIEISSQEPQPN